MPLGGCLLGWEVQWHNPHLQVCSQAQKESHGHFRGWSALPGKCLVIVRIKYEKTDVLRMHEIAIGQLNHYVSQGWLGIVDRRGQGIRTKFTQKQVCLIGIVRALSANGFRGPGILRVVKLLDKYWALADYEVLLSADSTLKLSSIHPIAKLGPRSPIALCRMPRNDLAEATLGYAVNGEWLAFNMRIDLKPYIPRLNPLGFPQY